MRAEYAYRRGFMGGAWYAICAVRGGASLDDLLAWYGQVDEWRNSDRRTRVEWPPIPQRMSTR